MEHDRLGRRFGRYELVERLGAGGMGEVYLARDQTLQRSVALEILHSADWEDERALEHLGTEPAGRPVSRRSRVPDGPVR